MELQLKPGHWYKADTDLVSLAELHNQYEEMVKRGCSYVYRGVGESKRSQWLEFGEKASFPSPGNLADSILPRHRPTYIYELKQHIRSASRDILALTTKDESALHDVVECYLGKEIAIPYYYNADDERMFITNYGPLIHDFADYFRPYPNYLPLFAVTQRVELAMVGDERIFWSDWGAYCQGLRRSGLTSSNITPLMYTPIEFYLWAADMLAALKRYRNWWGCQLFLANRIMSMQILPSTAWAKNTGLYLIGELFDYLALHIAYGVVNVKVDTRKCATPYCGNEFSLLKLDKRFKFCPECRAAKVQGSVRAKRYRSKGN